MGNVTIRRSSASAVLNHPDFQALRGEYVAECAVLKLPDPREKAEMYVMLDNTEAFFVFAAVAGASRLVGFVTLIAPMLPHYGRVVAVTESLFVAAAHRRTGAGMLLLRRAEQCAREIGSPGLLISAPSGGRLAALLPRLKYRETNRAYFKEFAHD